MLGLLLHMDIKRAMFGFICVLALTVQLTASVTLDFSHSNLTDVPPVTQPVRSIKVLRLDHNIIEELRPPCFANYSSLTILDLDFNPLRIVYNGTFDDLRTLTYFYMVGDQIIQLPSDFGPPTTTLRVWNIWMGLKNPEILKYPYLAAFVNLEFLTIGGDDVNIGNGSVLPHTTKKIELAVKYNDLAMFPHFSMYTPNVLLVQLKYNKISTIPDEELESLTSLTRFHITGNQIMRFPDFSQCIALHTLMMGRNKIASVPRAHIDGLASINEFDLSNNVIDEMVDISNLSTLQTFRIGSNQLTELPETYLSGLFNMTLFDCQHNYISFLPNISRLFPRLEQLYIQGNNLKTLNDLYDMVTLSILYAAENPYVCN